MATLATASEVEAEVHSSSQSSSSIDQIETQEWLDSLDFVLDSGGPERVAELLKQLEIHAQRNGVCIPFAATTPYINTIGLKAQPAYPGDREIERRIKSIIRWNAMAMVVRAQKTTDSGGRGGEVGGHISTYASSATLLEVGFNHFFRAPQGDSAGDQIFFQGHGSPGPYARAFVEGRLSEQQLINFRQELQPAGGLSSYPHPWLMPDFWQFPTVSMGLGPILSIYQARFNRYLEHRGHKKTSDSRVWAFLGDGECDEPESLGSITLAGREKLDNLTWVVNCNLQRLDGPVRGNGKIIQELEGIFRGAGWNVIKVIWGSGWDPLLEADERGELVQRMGEVVDGQYQKYTVESGAYAREHFFNSPYLQKIASQLTDDEIRKIKRGGHDPEKVFAAYHTAVNHKGQPTVILAKTVKGYGLGESAEGKMGAHNTKKMEEEATITFKNRFEIPISDDDARKLKFYRPAEDSPEMKYIKERRAALGGPVPQRSLRVPEFKTPLESDFEEFYKGSGEHAASTTMAFGNVLRKLMRNKEIGKLIVPIIPDEARTFGLDGLFGSYGIYSSVGQLYEPVDRKELAYYKESQNGQILEEGINEAGAMSSFIAAGTAYATHGVNTIPFYIYYSMFGPQRVGDLVWLAADIRARGFMMGATAGRTTLNGEGLQHEDGHSHLLAYTFPNLVAYDPAYAYELAIIIREGLRRMYENGEAVFYYITLMNENYAQPPMPEGEGIKEGILKGMYPFKKSQKSSKLKATLFGSGTILNEVIKAQEILEEKYGVAADVWSITSYKELNRDGLDCERYNLLHPGEAKKVPYVTQQLESSKDGVFVASSDYMKVLPDSIAKWVPGRLYSLGTDGFGRSETRPALRDFFEVDHRFVVLATLTALAEEKKIKLDVVKKAIKDLNINPDKLNPLTDIVWPGVQK
ncbi:MAG TPA: pyruvate dehydrogenase (acetyl-transferring), homodimeric type [Abditibacteriaceae bacterium]|jgi:pyruvate dehydrogenase E1 component